MIARSKGSEEVRSRKSSEENKRDIFSIDDGSKKQKKEFRPKFEH
jgi:hypothetical protein